MSNITVNITRGANPTSRTAFGTALLLINTATDYVEYANLDAVAVDFAAGTLVNNFARAYFGQETVPTKLAVAGAAYTETVAVNDETLTLVSGNIYSFDNNNVIVGSLANLENGGTPIPTADIVEIDYAAGTIEFATSKTTVTTDYEYYGDPADITALLTQLVLDDRNFYGIMLEASGYRAQKAVNDWVGTQKKLPAFRTNLLPAEYPVTLGSSVQPYYHLTENEYPEAAVFGKVLPKDPGSLTWNLQTLSGITAQNLTVQTESLLATGRFNSVTLQYGAIATLGGYYGTDLFADQRRSQDYIEVTMANNIGMLLVSVDKVPYDDRGITQVVSVVEDTLNTAYNNGIIADRGDGKTPDFVVTSQSRVDIVANDPQAITDRILRSVEFRYVEAGAIEAAAITGQVVIQL